MFKKINQRKQESNTKQRYCNPLETAKGCCHHAIAAQSGQKDAVEKEAGVAKGSENNH